MKQQVSGLVAVVKANHVQGTPQGTTQQNAQKWKSNKQMNPNVLGS